ncbi:MAG: amino acid permease [Gemmatimonadota bacterium]
MKRLKKELQLFDVYAISTGAMFSSGFFLLPGLAAGKAGPSVVLAYLLAGLLVVPAMLSKAELSTAMPRAGGTYYFLDRSMGPMVGTIGGFGTWLALVLKSSFALIGMGAYLSLFLNVEIQALALLLTGLFVLLNVVGAKQSSGVQRVLVVTLLVILTFFLAQGLAGVGSMGLGEVRRTRFTPFLPFGTDGLVSTVGLVFVSYVGLTKVASIPEEVKDPERNIPLAMFLSLATATLVYVVGVFVMVAVLEPSALRNDLTPVATAGEAVMHWLPGRLGMILIAAAAVAAFSAMANAGVMAASRYPLAMARDRLIWPGFSRLGRFHTPSRAVVATGGMMAVVLLTLDVEGVAKLASSLQLLLFGLINLAVVVMRESRLAAYDPGFRSPLYPWMQIAGFGVPFLLIAEMGGMSILFTLAVTAGSIGWYVSFARPRVERQGAMFHLFERLGRQRFSGLDEELREILKEKGLRKQDPFDEVVAGASVVDRPGALHFEAVAQEAAGLLAADLPVTPEELAGRFLEGTRLGITPVAHGVALPHARLAAAAGPSMVLVRAREGIQGGLASEDEDGPGEPIRAAFFLVSSEEDPSQHLRILAQLAGRADDDGFMREWLSATNEQELKEAVLRNERYLSLCLHRGTAAAALIGRTLREVHMPEGCLVALVRRDGEVVVPGGGTVLKAEDRLTIIGSPDGIRQLEDRYRGAA